MRLTIERLRTLVLAAGILLIVALVAFLAIGKIRNPLNRKDLPKRLGIDIEQEANGFTHTEFRSGRELFKINASKVEQLKDGHFELHFVKIEMYGPEGQGADSIEGKEFEYDQKSGIARAAGAVEITIAQPSRGDRGLGTSGSKSTGQSTEAAKIHVRTSGLTFNQKSGVAVTAQAVAFDLLQGSGRSVGARFDSQNGHLELDHAVEIDTHRGIESVSLRAAHAEIDRNAQTCKMEGAEARYRGGEAHADASTLHFRDDGSAEELDITRGLVLTTATGGKLAAPSGVLDFDSHSEPTRGVLEGGVAIDSHTAERTVDGTAKNATMEFAEAGMLRHAQLQGKVRLAVAEQSIAKGVPVESSRLWNSPVADLDFRHTPHGQVELADLRGTGGVVVAGSTRRGDGPRLPSKMSADEVTAAFGANSTLKSLTGVGNASLMETTAQGMRQTMSGDRLGAFFSASDQARQQSKHGGVGTAQSGTEIQSADITGHVVITQTPSAGVAQGAQNGMRAMAEDARYDGSAGWMHLRGNPRVENDGMQLTADAIDVSQESSRARAHGDVKATWFGNSAGAAGAAASPARMPSLGADGPVHVIADEAQLQQSTGEIAFKGKARMWQASDSIAAPVIVLNRKNQTLTARTASAADPVRLVLVSVSRQGREKPGMPMSPSVIRVQSGDLDYSDAARTAVLRGGVTGAVVAEAGEGTTRANRVDLTLLPAGGHGAGSGMAGQVDRMTATGGVTVDLQGRHGTGNQLVFSSKSEEYVLTGTAASPPRLTDPVRGEVTGTSLIFNSRDDSVSVEGGGQKTLTETNEPKRP